MPSKINVKKRTTTTNAVYLPQLDGVNIEAAKPPAFINYETEKRGMEMLLFRMDDAIFEIGNEGTDLYFAFDELQSEDPLLFYVSMGFLGLSLLLRLTIALGLLWKVRAGKLKFKPNRWTWTWCAAGVLLSLIEPMSGTQLIAYAIGDSDAGAWDNATSDAAAKAKKLRSESETMLRNAWTMVLFEDVPELIIQLVYLYRTGGQIKNVPLFVIDIFFTVLHLLRLGTEVQFERKFAKHIPNPDSPDATVKVGKSDTAGVTQLAKQQFDRCHQICSVELRDFSGAASKQVGQFAAFMVKYSKSLGYVNLSHSEVGDGFGVEVAKGLARNTTLTFLGFVFAATKGLASSLASSTSLVASLVPRFVSAFAPLKLLLRLCFHVTLVWSCFRPACCCCSSSLRGSLHWG